MESRKNEEEPQILCPREIVPRGLTEYIIERVYQVFLSFEPFEFVIVHKSEGWAPP